MGGNKCCFRQCCVSNAKLPRIRFFRFPIKDKDRYKKWRQYSKMEHMIQFSEVRSGNYRVCARHFRMECFMNYKMDRLVPSAVPTIMRLPNNQALDFELDMENGILVTMENTKLKHLIPPVGFECPLSLMNHKTLENPNELETEQYCIVHLTDLNYLSPGKSLKYEEITMDKPGKTLVNSVEILETIQVAAPNSKRPREIEEEGSVISATVSNRKCRVLKPSWPSESNIKSGASVALSTRTIQLENFAVDIEEIDFVDTDQIRKDGHLLNEEFLTNEAFNNADSEQTNDTVFPEIDKDENTLQYELLPSDSKSQELSEMQRQLFEFKKTRQEFEILQTKFSSLEAENYELKNACKENKCLNKKLLSLQMENNHIKNTLKDYENLKDEYCEKNKQLEEDAANIEMLKSELVSRREETKELKKLLETLQPSLLKKQKLEKQYSLDIENERSISMAKETKLNEEIVTLKHKLELKQKLLKDTEYELFKVKENLNDTQNENDRLMQQQNELQESFKNTQNTISIKENNYRTLKSDYDNLHQTYCKLEQKYYKLQVLQNQESTVSTSLGNTIGTNTTATPTAVGNSLTKAQLFNGIKRYLSASMVSLLRMEMFGSSEREWKTDERQVAVDILRLGEMVYKYFTDEWRFRLPALRDVRNWFNQSQQMIDDEEDL